MKIIRALNFYVVLAVCLIVVLSIQEAVADKSSGHIEDLRRVRLACVTARLSGENTTQPIITSFTNLQEEDAEAAFVTDPFDQTVPEDWWGLICAKGYSLTHCGGSWMLNQPAPVAGLENTSPDTRIKRNGCFSDDEEIWEKALLYATCCKVVILS